MKRLIIFLLASLCFLQLDAQLPTGISHDYGFKYYRYKNYLQVDSAILLPTRATNWTPKGPALIYSLRYLWYYDTTGNTWHKMARFSDATGIPFSYVDSIWRMPGIDSIFFSINGTTDYKIKDNIGITTRDRFGLSGEDVTATANRTFTLGGYTFRIATGTFKADSLIIFGVEDETPITNTVVGINGRSTALSFMRMWDQDDNVIRFDFRENGDIYGGGAIMWEAANRNYFATRIDLTQRVVTPIISNSPGANDKLQLAPGSSDGEVIVGNSGTDAGDYKFQTTGGLYVDVTGKTLKFVAVPAGTVDSVLGKKSDGNYGLMATSSISGGGGGSAGRLFKSLNANTTLTGNEGTGEDDLSAYTIPADTLNTNGDQIEFIMTFTFAANANAKRVRVYYGATTIYDSGSQNQNSGSMEIRGTIIRKGATSQLISFSQNNDAALFPIRSGYTTAAETLSSTVILKATAEAVADNDIQQILLTVKMIPNS